VLSGSDCAEGAPQLPACADDGDEECTEHAIRAVVPSAAVEADEISAVTRDRDLTEQMWINYYVDRGSLKSDVRQLNDAVAGFNADHGTKFRAPKDAGNVNVWAVVHDNRGGMNWVRTQICVR
jgi:hypothetical protein